MSLVWPLFWSKCQFSRLSCPCSIPKHAPCLTCKYVPFTDLAPTAGWKVHRPYLPHYLPALTVLIVFSVHVWSRSLSFQWVGMYRFPSSSSPGGWSSMNVNTKITNTQTGEPSSRKRRFSSGISFYSDVIEKQRLQQRQPRIVHESSSGPLICVFSW